MDGGHSSIHEDYVVELLPIPWDSRIPEVLQPSRLKQLTVITQHTPSVSVCAVLYSSTEQLVVCVCVCVCVRVSECVFE
jgi:hypothetical protein